MSLQRSGVPLQRYGMSLQRCRMSLQWYGMSLQWVRDVIRVRWDITVNTVGRRFQYSEEGIKVVITAGPKFYYSG